MHSTHAPRSPPPGIANCGIGVALTHALQGDKLAYWVAPSAAVLAMLGAAAVVLERRRGQVRGGALRWWPPYGTPPSEAGAPRSRAWLSAPPARGAAPTPPPAAPRRAQMVREGTYEPSTHAFGAGAGEPKGSAGGKPLLAADGTGRGFNNGAYAQA